MLGRQKIAILILCVAEIISEVENCDCIMMLLIMEKEFCRLHDKVNISDVNLVHDLVKFFDYSKRSLRTRQVFKGNFQLNL